MFDPNKITWKNVWIIGASSGIGEELAIQLAPHCETIAVSARSADKLKNLENAHPSIKAFPCDVTDAKTIRSIAKKIDQASAPLDLVVISSGFWNETKVPEFEPASFQKAMDINFQGVINVLAATSPSMTERGKGHIAILSSVAGYSGLPNSAAYAPTKAALINLAEAIKPQMKEMGVTVSIVNPGFVETPMTEVNKFPMPFLMKVDEAAGRIIKGLIKKKFEIAFPMRLALILKFLRILPYPIYFWIMRNLVLRK